MNLPWSRGGVADGLAVLDELLPHLLDQVAGGDHPPRARHPRHDGEGADHAAAHGAGAATAAGEADRLEHGGAPHA